MTVRLDADRLLHAVAQQMQGELGRQGVHLDAKLVDSAAQAALGAAYGDAAATALVARLGADNPQLAAVLGTAFAYLKSHPGFWVGYYAMRHHKHPLPHDHPWAGAVTRAFGQSDALLGYHDGRHHHPHDADYYAHHPHHPAEHVAGYGHHHPHHAPHQHPHHQQQEQQQQGEEDYSAGYARRPAPPNFGPHAPYQHGPRPPGMAYGHRPAPPPPPPRAPYQGQPYAPPPPQYPQQAPSYGQMPPPMDPGYGAPPYAPPPAAPDYGALAPQAMPPMPDDGSGIDPSAAAPFDPSSLQGMYSADPTAAPMDPSTDVSTAGVGDAQWVHWVRHQLKQWLIALRATPLPPGVSAAQRDFLLQQLIALVRVPTQATATSVITQLAQAMGPEAARYAAAIPALFGLPAFAWPPAAPLTTSGYMHPGEVVESGQRELPHEAHERIQQEAVQRAAYHREQGGRPGEPFLHGPAAPYGHPYAPPGAPRPGAPRPGAPVGLNTYERWTQIHPNTSHQDYVNWWNQYGSQGATIEPDPPMFGVGYRHSPGVVYSAPGMVHSAPRGRRAGPEWWGGYGAWYGPEYVIDQRNELEDAPFSDDVEPDNQRVD